MLSIDLFDSKFERSLHEGAVDDAEYARLKKLGEKIDYLKQARAKTTDSEMRRAIDNRIEQYNSERREILSVRGMKEAELPQQPPAKGLLKGKDLVTPQQRVAAATPAKPGVMGAVKDVASGIKRFVKGEPDQGPTYEAYVSATGEPNYRATGNANMGLLIKSNSFKQVRPVTFEFPNEKPLPLDAHQTELLSDYYDGFKDDTQRNNFIYNVLSNKETIMAIMKKLGAPVQPTQTELPLPSGTQGQLPLSEKKKSKAQDDIKAGDVKVARELQKLRALYPAARSDVEAVARAEIDSSERSRQQIAAIQGANAKQDDLLKQLVALDREQGKEIDGLDQENNSLEQQLAQVQVTNDRLTQTIGQMTGTKVSARNNVIDLIPGATVDRKPTSVKTTLPAQQPTGADAGTQPAKTTSADTGAKVFGQIAKSVTSPEISPVSKLKGLRVDQPEVDDSKPANDPQGRLVAEKSVKEHGGGIGPRQHWQSMMRNEGWSDKNNPTPYSVYIDGREWKTFATDEHARNVADKVRDNLKLQGRDQTVTIGPSQSYLKGKKVKETFNVPGVTVPRKSVIQGYTVFFNPETQVVSVTRGGHNEEAAIEQQRIGTVNVKNFRATAERLIDKIENEDQIINEGIKDAASATAVIACLLTGGSLTGCATAPQQTSAQQVLKTGQDIGRTVQTAQRITRAGAEAEVNQEIRNLLRGIGGRPEELNHSNILRIWRKIKGAPPVQPEPQEPEYGPAEPVKRPAQFEEKQIRTKQEFDRAMDSIANQLRGETNPAIRQMLNLQLKVLQNRGQAEGWFKGTVREDTAALAAEDAILKRIFVKHRDLMMEYGPDKIAQAAESVSYNVGDIAHITDDQITEWIGQVEQILGATP